MLTVTKLRRDWLDLRGAHFLIMGGVVLVPKRDSSSVGNDTTPDQWAVPGYHGLVLMIKNGCFKKMIERGELTSDMLNPEMVQDKSKADTIAKFLVTLQIFWMFVDCFGRLASRLSLSILEIHVLIHVIYTIIIYALWWHKPKDIELPVFIRASKEHYEEYLKAGSEHVSNDIDAGSSASILSDSTSENQEGATLLRERSKDKDQQKDVLDQAFKEARRVECRLYFIIERRPASESNDSRRENNDNSSAQPEEMKGGSESKDVTKRKLRSLRVLW